MLGRTHCPHVPRVPRRIQLQGAKISGTPHHEARRSHDPKLILKSERNIKKHQETVLWQLWQKIQKMMTCQDMNRAEPLPLVPDLDCNFLVSLRIPVAVLSIQIWYFSLFERLSLNVPVETFILSWINVVPVETWILSSSHTTHVQEAVVPCRHRGNATRSDPWLRIGLTLVA